MHAELPVIIHVDDDHDILDITRMALQIVDSFELYQFDNAEDVLAQANDIRPDLFLLDVMMPGTTGPELWNSLRRTNRFSLTPTIFMTAKVETELSVELMREGALEVITKPFDPMKLGSQIREAWNRRSK